MYSKKFPEANVEVGKGQEKDYNILHANVDPTSGECQFTFCMKFNKEEIAKFVETGEIWVMQQTHRRAFQPMNLSVDKPDMIKHEIPNAG